MAAGVAGGGTSHGARGRPQRDDPSPAQRSWARRVAESKATIPYLYLRTEIDAGPLAARVAGADGPTPLDCAVRAVALALREQPALNGAWRDAQFERYERINVAVGAFTVGTWQLPVIHDADRKDAAAIARERAELGARLRAGELTRPQLSGPTFSVFGPSRGGVDELTPVIPPGQGAALGVGELRRAPVVRGSQVVAGECMWLTLCCDARLAQGEEAPDLLARVRELLEEPEGL